MDVMHSMFKRQIHLAIRRLTSTNLSTIHNARHSSRQYQPPTRLSQNYRRSRWYLPKRTSGIDFIQSTFRLTHDQAEVPVNIASNGADTATLTLAEPIALDGSDDGTYAIEIAPIDLAGKPWGSCPTRVLPRQPKPT